MKRLRPFFSFYGAKWRLASKYPPPKYSTIIEPFAGSAQYATLYHDRKVILYDKDPIITGLWQYLIQVSEAEILSLPDCYVGTVDDLDICQEAKWLIGFWILSAVTSPAKSMSTWGKAAGYNDTRYWGPKVRARVTSQLQYIRHWKVVESSYVDIPNQEATWFVDPPYENKGYKYHCSSKAIDFSHLGEWCRQRDGQVTVCENEGATWLPFQPFHATQSARMKEGKANWSKEVVWVKDQQ